MPQPARSGHSHRHAFEALGARRPEGLTLLSRRNMLKAGLAGMAGLSLPDLLRARADASAAGKPISSHRSVILLWMAGGPSHIDTWDSKPGRPVNNRGPFGVTQTKLPGVVICEHLPKQAAMLDQFTIIRSVDARNSNHEPNKVFQTGNLAAAPRTNPRGDMYPSIGSVVAKYHGANHPLKKGTVPLRQGDSPLFQHAAMPPYVTFMISRSHIAFAGYLGKRYDPFVANRAADLPIYTNVGVDTGRTTGGDLFQLPAALSQDRIHQRSTLLEDFDRLRSDLDRGGSMAAMDTYQRQAVDILVGRQAQEAFDLSREPQAVRERYGKHLWCQQALLARRLVERGVSFVTLDLSYHPASGTWDTHGDNIPPYGGIKHGLGPLLPLFDHLITTLVSDLGERGLLEEVLVVAMGEFGRTPNMGTQGSTDGRNHWPVVMSMCLAGGGLRHGQVIGATEPDGGHIKSRPVTPADLAATIYRHMQVPLDTQYLDPRGRPRYVVEGGEPLAELF